MSPALALKLNSLADGLKAAGFEPIFFPVIEVLPLEDNSALDKALQTLPGYDWVVFTSVNGVEIFFEHLPPAFDGWHMGGISIPRVAAIGPKTAEALRRHGVEPAFVPDEYVAEAIFEGLGDLRGKWVLLPRAEIARKELPDAICRAGGTAA